MATFFARKIILLSRVTARSGGTPLVVAEKNRGALGVALRGVKYRPMAAAALLPNNLLIYGVGGIIIPFIGIKLIDMLITRVGLA